VFYSQEDDGFIAVASDLPGCSAFGNTQEEAVAELRNAIAAWQIAATKAGNPVPEPSKHQADDLPSGKILLRLPRSLHAQLIERAKQDNVSLNQHLVMVLTASTAAQYIRNVVAEQMQSVHRYWDRALIVHQTQDFSRSVCIVSTGRQIQATQWQQDYHTTIPMITVSSRGEAVNG
jgi:predicted RNase H-like HicB family nuclease